MPSASSIKLYTDNKFDFVSSGWLETYGGIEFKTGLGSNRWLMWNNSNAWFQIADQADIGVRLIPGTSTWGSVSDVRVKHNINPILQGLDSISKLNPVSYCFNGHNNVNFGFIAQEVEQIIPELVRNGIDINDFKSLEVQGIIPFLVKAVQEQQMQIESLNSVVANQQTQINSLNSEVEYLKTQINALLNK